MTPEQEKSKRPTADMREIDRVHLEAMIHPVRLGAKPVSSTSHPTADLAEVLEIIRKRDLRYSVRKVVLDWYEVYFFSKPHLKHVIENAPVFEDPVVEAWYWGKLYGYSEEAIASYADKLRSPALWARWEGVVGIVQCDGHAVCDTFVGADSRLLSRGRHTLHLLSRFLRSIISRFGHKKGK